jgi:hypothetical protein
VAGTVTVLLVPSSVMLAALVSQLTGGVSVPACSNVKLAVSGEARKQSR